MILISGKGSIRNLIFWIVEEVKSDDFHKRWRFNKEIKLLSSRRGESDDSDKRWRFNAELKLLTSRTDNSDDSDKR